MRAWLHRKHKNTWLFEPSQIHGRLVHCTKYGNTYAIFDGMAGGKPFWIGQLVEHGGKKYWCTVEKELRAVSIEFEGAGRYSF
jgi:hypothetical protein